MRGKLTERDPFRRDIRRMEHFYASLRGESRNFRPAPGPGGGGSYGGYGGASSSGSAGTAGGAAGGAVSAAAAGAGGSAGDIYNLAPHLFPTVDFQNFDKMGSVALPAIGTSATILSFEVPDGYNGRIFQIAWDFVANGATTTGLFTQGVVPAQLTATIEIDGTPVPDYTASGFQWGFVDSPTGIAGIMLTENQTVTLLVTNVSVVVAAQFVEGRLGGYFYNKSSQVPGSFQI
jgi:hypothetical protein